MADGERGIRVCLDKKTTEARAREVAASLTEKATKAGKVREVVALPAPAEAPKGLGVDEWFAPWLDARDAKGNTSVDDDRGRFKKWIKPFFVDRTMTDVGKRDLERFVQHLDEQVRAGALSWRTAKNVWGIVTKAFDDAHRSKLLQLRVREDNPAKDVVGPDDGPKKSKQYIYPDEFLAAMNCARVPQRWRRLIAVNVYLYCRAGELEALAVVDVDLEHRVVHIHRAIDRQRGEVKETKTNNPRRFPIETNLFPLIEQLVKEARAEGRERLVTMPPLCDLSTRLRKYLDWAGVARAELYAESATCKRMTFHDLRATGATWMAIRGDEPQRIMARCGHENMATTMGYIREAESLAVPPEAAFPHIPPSVILPNDLPEGPRTWGRAGGKSRKSLSSKERPQRDSKPVEDASKALKSAQKHASDGGRTGLIDADKCAEVRLSGSYGQNGISEQTLPGWVPYPVDADANFARPRIAPEASARAGARLERGLRLVRSELPSPNPEAEVLSLLGAACDDLGLTAGGAS